MAGAEDLEEAEEAANRRMDMTSRPCTSLKHGDFPPRLLLKVDIHVQPQSTAMIRCE